jgi:hypothetical protein
MSCRASAALTALFLIGSTAALAQRGGAVSGSFSAGRAATPGGTGQTAVTTGGTGQTAVTTGGTGQTAVTAGGTGQGAVRPPASISPEMLVPPTKAP